MPQPVRFETGRAMLFGGLRRHHRFQQADFAGQWRDFNALGPLPGQLGEHGYGVICGADEQGGEYMCAVEVADLAVLPPALGRMRITAQTYAVFRHQGPYSTLPQSWQQAFDWLARSDYHSAQRPDFERYSATVDPQSGERETELWLAVIPRQALA